MDPRPRILLLSAVLAGCGGPDEGETATAAATSDGEAPDFSLLDVNPNSESHGQPVSPRDYLERVSGWYFAHAT